MKIYTRLLAATLVLLLAGGCAVSPLPPPEDISSQPQEQPSYQAPPEPQNAITVLAAGDNLIHDVIYKQAAARGNGVYDFTYAYRQVAPLIAAADIALLNQETPVLGSKPPQNYPRFSSPPELAQHMQRLGFDVVTHANNHMLDQGVAGLAESLSFWQQQNIPVAGVYPTGQPQPVVLEAGGIRVAFIGLTQHTNGLPRPKDAELDFLLTSQTEEIQAQLAAAKQQADFVIVTPHWGEENTHTPTAHQRTLAQQLADWGADAIVGHHSHTVQPVEYVTAADGRQVAVAYSLGNFISAMDNAQNMMGMLLELTLLRQADGSVTLDRLKVIPIVTHYETNMRNVTVYPLSEYSEALAAGHGVRYSDSRFSHRYLTQTLENLQLA